MTGSPPFWPDPVTWANTYLPLPIQGATLGTCWFNVHGVTPARWQLTVFCPWQLLVGDRVVLSDDDMGPVDSDEPVAWLVGDAVTLMAASDAEGAEPVFHLRGGGRLRVRTTGWEEPGEERYVLSLPDGALVFTGLTS